MSEEMKWTNLDKLRPGAVFQNKDGQIAVKCGFDHDATHCCCIRLDSGFKALLGRNTAVREIPVPAEAPASEAGAAGLTEEEQEIIDEVFGYDDGSRDDRDKLKPIIDRLARENGELRDVLQELHDVQNGPPLHKYEKDWNEAMRKAEILLAQPAADAAGKEKP